MLLWRPSPSACPGREVMTVVGCGAQGRSGVRGFLSQFPSLKEIRALQQEQFLLPQHSRGIQGALHFPHLYQPPGGRPRKPNRPDGLQQHEVLVKADWLEPGTTVLALAAFNDMDPEATEAADRMDPGVRTSG